jgi:hypothetical protein
VEYSGSIGEYSGSIGEYSRSTVEYPQDSTVEYSGSTQSESLALSPLSPTPHRGL